MDQTQFVPEYRRSTFKDRYSGDRRQKRDAQVLKLRRSRRDQKMAKTRLISDVDLNESEDEDNSDDPQDATGYPYYAYGHSHSTGYDHRFLNQQRILNQDLQTLQSKLIYSDELSDQQYAARLIREILSLEQPPIDQILNIEGILPRLVDYLSWSDYPHVQLDAAWALTNIASGTSEQTRALVDCNSIPALMKLLVETTSGAPTSPSTTTGGSTDSSANRTHTASSLKTSNTSNSSSSNNNGSNNKYDSNNSGHGKPIDSNNDNNNNNNNNNGNNSTTGTFSTKPNPRNLSNESTSAVSNNVLATQVLWALGNIAGEHWKYRDWILSLDVAPCILHLADNLPPEQNVTWALSNLCRGQELEHQWQRLRPLLPAVRKLLYMGEHNGIGETAWALYGLCGINQAMPELEQFVGDLSLLLESRSVTVRIPVLRTLGAMMNSPPRIQSLIDQGILTRTEAILTDPNCLSLHQDACFVLSNIGINGSGKQVSEMLRREIAYVLRTMTNSRDIPARIEACWVIRNSLLNKDMTPQLAQLNLIDKGVIPPLCRQLEPSEDNLVLKLCLESLQRVLKNGAAKMTDGINVLAVYIEQLGGVDKLNRIVDDNRNAEVYKLASNLIDVYFSDVNRF